MSQTAQIHNLALVRTAAERLSSRTRGPMCAPGDLNQDGVVDIVDLLALLAAWGPCNQPCPPSCAGDLNGDCAVGIVELLAMLANWS